MLAYHSKWINTKTKNFHKLEFCKTCEICRICNYYCLKALLKLWKTYRCKKICINIHQAKNKQNSNAFSEKMQKIYEYQLQKLKSAQKLTQVKTAINACKKSSFNEWLQ